MDVRVPNPRQARTTAARRNGKYPGAPRSVVAVAAAQDVAAGMPAGGVLVRPVQQPTLGVPEVLAPQGQRLAGQEARYPRRQVNIVGNQQGNSGLRTYQEALMPRSFAIIWQRAHNLSLYDHRDVAAVRLEGLGGRVHRLARPQARRWQRQQQPECPAGPHVSARFHVAWTTNRWIS